jgi:NAD(P)-dependent dehydrogenase (short-subunit alcohol dehydrogenase family)
MDVRSLHGKTALVTGAASGIGKETALAFARRGADLVVCDIDEAGLAATAEAIRALGRNVQAERTDVANAAEMEALADSVHARIEAVDLLMNNAGVAIGGPFLATSLADWDWIVGINLRGVVHGCHFFIPAMKRRGLGGHVINVSSAAGYTASSALAAYSATKFAVLGLSEALADELEPRGIGVTAVCPGIIDTPITRSARLVGEMDRAEVREQMVTRYQRRGYGPERVAENVLKAVQRNRLVAPISPEAWAFYYLKRFAPRLLRRLGRSMSARVTKSAGGQPTNRAGTPSG